MGSLTTIEKLAVGIVAIGLLIFVGLRIGGELLNQEQVRIMNIGVETATCNLTASVSSGCTGTTVTAMTEVISAIGGIPAWMVIIVVVVIGGFLILFLRKGLGGKSF